MVLAALLTVLGSTSLSAAETNGEGASPSEMRKLIRPLFTLAPAASVGVNYWLGSEVSAALGFGLAFDAGLIVGDRAAVALHAQGTFLPSSDGSSRVAMMIGGGPTFDWFLDDHWSVGSGGLMLAFFGASNLVSLALPARLQWRLTGRAASARVRSSFVVGLQLGVGFSLMALGSPAYEVDLTGSALLTVGYGWW